jgi:hypothetical protein
LQAVRLGWLQETDEAAENGLDMQAVPLGWLRETHQAVENTQI